MSIFPKKYHDSGLKCAGPQFCSDCRERIRLGIPMELSPSDKKDQEKWTKEIEEFLKKNLTKNQK